MRADGVDTADQFEKKMSTLSAHEMLRAKLAVLPPVGALNLWSAKGLLINSSEMWPVPDRSIADRRYFREFTSGRPTPDMILEPVVSKVTKVWTMVFARKIVGRNGEIMGFTVRGVEPSHFEDFVGSLALDSDTAISMIHRDGTIIARYPQDDKLIGLNVAGTPAFQRALAMDGNISGRFTSSRLSEDKVGAVRSLEHFPIVVVATTKTSTVLADWRAQTRLQFCAAALAIVIVIGMVFLPRVISSSAIASTSTCSASRRKSPSPAAICATLSFTARNSAPSSATWTPIAPNFSIPSSVCRISSPRPLTGVPSG